MSLVYLSKNTTVETVVCIYETTRELSFAKKAFKGNVVCSNCSDHKHALKKFGYDNPVRCCNTCEKLIQMQNMNSNELSKLSPKVLKEYINAYHLPSKMALEKSDLVRIIFNTRPISNDNELYYRRNRTKPSDTNNAANNDKKSFSFSNMMQELFTPNSNVQESQNTSNISSNNNEQQRREEEARRILQEQRQRQEQNRRMQQQQQQHQQQQQAQRQRQQQAERERLDREQREQYMRQQQQQQQQQQRQRQANSSPRQSPPIPNSENMLSLHDMIKSNIDPSSLSVRTLKSILKANYVEQSHVIEKSELVKLVVRLVDSYKAEHDSNSGSESGTGASANEDTLCRICMDAQQNCVFLDCGHMVTCMNCAKKLIESKNECPICREPILKLVHVFRS